MTSIQGTGQAGQINYHHEPLRTGNADPSIKPHLDALADAFRGRMDDLNEQIAQTNDPGAKLGLQEEMRRLEGQFDVVRNHPQAGGPVTSALPFDIGELIADMRNTLARSYQNFGTASLPRDTVLPRLNPLLSDTIVKNLPQLKVSDRMAQLVEHRDFQTMCSGLTRPGVSPSDRTSTEGTRQVDATEAPTETEGTSGAGADTNIAEMDPREAIELFNRDPLAFYDALKDVDNPQDRMMLMNMVQTELQQINQLFSMMSQFSQSIHDTQKAVINNLRV